VPILSRDTPPHLVLSGEIDIASAEDLRLAGARSVDLVGPGEPLEIDVAGVSFIDSSGLGALVSIRRLAETTGHRTVLLGLSSSIERLLELTGLRDSFATQPGSSES
jgi:anti-anti-sigma factor